MKVAYELFFAAHLEIIVCICFIYANIHKELKMHITISVQNISHTKKYKLVILLIMDGLVRFNEVPGPHHGLMSNVRCVNIKQR